MSSTRSRLLHIYTLLDAHFGAQHWWPAESPFEVLVGAVLTQNTNWKNVEQSIDMLKRARVLSFEALLALPEAELAALIRSSGYFNLKARRLKNLLQMISSEYGDPAALFADETSRARQALLHVKGIGPETADSIMLYAAGQPLFVVDSYTHRILSRHELVPEESDYQTIHDLFMDNLTADAALFNQYHALLVRTAQEFCLKNGPRCPRCPLRPLL